MKRRLILDGKAVRVFLFARYSRVVLPGAIPVDTRERRVVLNMSEQKRYLVLAQVEAFDKDHAMRRLTEELFPNIARGDWEFLEELDPEHDVGKMGSKHPLLPLVVANPGTMQ